MLNLTRTALLSLPCLLLACGGGGDDENDGSGDSPAAILTGAFIDAPVAGLSYSASSDLSGTTNSSGHFSYRSGDTVSFSLGGIQLGSTVAAAVITPRDLPNLTESGATNLARFLLTLDRDQDSSNGIQLSTEVISSAASASIAATTFNSADFDNSDAASFATSANGDSRELVTAAQADSHLNQTDDDLQDGQFDNTQSADADADNVRDADDNCVDTANADQADADGDGIGDACDTAADGDRDGDQIPDSQDNCPDLANADQSDIDRDGLGDACDSADDRTAAWIINTSERSTEIFQSNSNTGVLVNVQSVAELSQSNSDYTYVQATGIPAYSVTLTQDDVDQLNARPRAANNDFASGSTTAQAGQTVVFGQDIGYNSSNENCNDTGGAGYWPPGPGCPTQQTKQGYFPQQAEPTASVCESGLGVLGYWVNGTSIYNWGDGQSAEEGVWYTLAPVAEQYDVDICGGHAANGDYHHHFYSSCLARLVGDQADGHSPIYGFAADGYPIHGPWEADGQLAISSWVVRDYSAGSATGCGAEGERSCVLVDEYDVSQGTTAASATGPSTTDTYRTLSGNRLTASAGFFYEDYYWDADLTLQGSPYLDQYNGHDSNELGYHYHVTVEQTDNGLSPSFPYTVGARFAGQLHSNGVTRCSGQTGGGDGGMGPRP